jgi:ribosomal protein L17
MKKIKSIAGRLSNYKGLNYSFIEFLKFVIFKKVLFNNFVSRLKSKEKIEFTEINVQEIKTFVISLIERKDRRQKIRRGLSVSVPKTRTV